MHILIAPDKFKGSLTAKQAAHHIAAGIRRVLDSVTITQIPMADGGEGTVQSLVDATGGQLVSIEVTGPLGTPVSASFGILGDGQTAVIEMAAASGLALITSAERDPENATTYGTGELLLAAAKRGCRKVVIGIGGSATNDGGAGMAQALGARLLDASGRELPPGGIHLARLAKIDISGIDPQVKRMSVVVACDVTNPLCGVTGASTVYGPQKGATPEMVVRLDQALSHYADIIARDLDKDVRNVPGAGAAGGLGAGLMAFLDAELERGVDIIIDVVGLDAAMQNCDLVITGEGGVDAQTAFGKAPAGVAQVAERYKKPVIVLAGSVADDARSLHDHGLHAIFSLCRKPMSLGDAIAHGAKYLEDTAEEVARLLVIGQQLSKS
ncbi:MAG TPA: glycerate kinase [Firmicutes bacterium]|jgi:glycerate kinase|nr:glycerate kinase [Bacillota bacterium]